MQSSPLLEGSVAVPGEGLKEFASGFLFMDTLDRGVIGYAGGWLIRGTRHSIIVDCGAGASVPLWLTALEQAGVPLDSVTWILLTHVHLDHAGAAGGLLRHLPNARIGIHPDGRRHLLNPERLLSQARQVWGKDFELLGGMEPAPEHRVVSLSDEDLIELDGARRLRVLYTPGHTPHHIAYFEETSRGIFPGDALGALFSGAHPFGEFMTIPGISPPKGDLPAYLGSVSRICALCPRKIYASHFGLWEPALPYINLAAGQIGLIWELCREVRSGGGELPEVISRVAQLLAGTRLSAAGQGELEKNYFAMAQAAWNYVITEPQDGT